MSGEFAGKVVRELGASLDLRTEQTGYRGHAGRLAAEAAKLGYEMVVTFGGDGTVNEVVDGPCGPTQRRPDTAQANTAQRVGAGVRPALAVVPGGDGNVFARTLGIPTEPPAAAAHIVRLVRSGASGRVIGLSLADSADLPQPRYFTFSAGLGLDAEVVADVERARRGGQQSSTLLYMRTALRRYYTATDRSKPALSLHIPGQTPTTGLFMGVVTNSSPWTYLGGFPMVVVPHERTDLNSGLDVFGLRRMRTLTTLYTLHQMMHSDSKPPTGPDVLTMAAPRSGLQRDPADRVPHRRGVPGRDRAGLLHVRSGCTPCHCMNLSVTGYGSCDPDDIEIHAQVCHGLLRWTCPVERLDPVPKGANAAACTSTVGAGKLLPGACRGSRDTRTRPMAQTKIGNNKPFPTYRLAREILHKREWRSAEHTRRRCAKKEWNHGLAPRCRLS